MQTLPDLVPLPRFRNGSKPSRMMRISRRSTTRRDACFTSHAQRERDHLLIAGVEPASEFLDDLLM